MTSVSARTVCPGYRFGLAMILAVDKVGVDGSSRAGRAGGSVDRRDGLDGRAILW